MSVSNERIMQDQIAKLQQHGRDVDARLVVVQDRVLQLAELDKQAADLATKHSELIANVHKKVDTILDVTQSCFRRIKELHKVLDS